MVGVLGALRMLPEVVGHFLHGERPAKPVSMRLRDLPEIPVAEGGWVLLGERPGEEIALGLVGKFWRPVIEFAPIESAEEYGVACAPADAWISSQASARRGAGQRPLVAPSSSAAPANAE